MGSSLAMKIRNRVARSSPSATSQITSSGPQPRSAASSSTRLYWETLHSGALRRPLERVTVPTGVARYPGEVVIRYPRSWVEQTYNVTHWAELPRGGHFAAMEQPDLFVDNLRTFFRTVR